MTRRDLGMLALIAMVCGAASAVRAAESISAPSASTMPAATPQISTSEGAITAMDVTSTAPSVTIRGAAGQSWTLALDPTNVSVWRNGQMGSLDELAVGAQVKARHLERDGQQWVRSIEIQASNTSTATPDASTTQSSY